MSEQTDREYVEGNWVRTETRRDAGRASIRFFTDNELYFLKPCESEARLWAAGREFTEERLAEIRQLDEEIGLIRSGISFYIIAQASEGEIYVRILTRLKSILEDKKRGMKL